MSGSVSEATFRSEGVHDPDAGVHRAETVHGPEHGAAKQPWHLP